MGQRVRVVGPGRAGTSFATALSAAGWHVEPLVGRSDPVDQAAHDVDLVIIATPDVAIAEVAAAIDPVGHTAIVHLSGALGPQPVAHHRRHGVLHPLVALPDGERGAYRALSEQAARLLPDPHPEPDPDLDMPVPDLESST